MTTYANEKLRRIMREPTQKTTATQKDENQKFVARWTKGCESVGGTCYVFKDQPRRGMIRRAAERMNPAIVVGAILAACVLWLVAGVAITDRVVMGECKVRTVQA